MKETIIATRYAKGLFDLALESGVLDQLDEDLARLAAAIEGVPQLAQALEDERVPLTRRSQALSAIAQALGLSTETSNALQLLLHRQRIGLLPLVARDAQARLLAYHRLATAHARVAAKDVVVETKRRIEEILGGLLKLTVSCDVEVDPALIGGFLVKLGDVRYDASVAGELARMKERLLNTEAGNMKQEA